MVYDLPILLSNGAALVPAHAGTNLSFFVLGCVLFTLLVFQHREPGMQNINRSG